MLQELTGLGERQFLLPTLTEIELWYAVTPNLSTDDLLVFKEMSLRKFTSMHTYEQEKK